MAFYSIGAWFYMRIQKAQLIAMLDNLKNWTVDGQLLTIISVCTRTIEIPLGCIWCRDMLKILTFSSPEVKILKIKFSTHNRFVHI